MDEVAAVAGGKMVVDRLQRAAAAGPGLGEEALRHGRLVAGLQREHAGAEQLDAGQHQIDDRRDGCAVPRHAAWALREDARLAQRVAQRRSALGERQLRHLDIARMAHQGMEAGVETEDDTDAARCALQPERQSSRDRRVGARADRLPLCAARIALQPGHGKRSAALARHQLHQVEFGIEPFGAVQQVEIAHELQHTARPVTEDLRKPGELRRCGLCSGRRHAGRGAVVVGASGREPGGTRRERFAQQPLHRGDVLGRGRFLRLRTIAHHRHAQRVMRYLREEIEGMRDALQRVEILGEGLPIETDTLDEGDAGDVLDAFHQRDQPFDGAVPVARCERGEADAAVAEEQRGHPVLHARTEGLVPARLAVVVGVQVDEPRGEPGAVGVDPSVRCAVHPSDLADDPVLHADIGGAWCVAGSVDDGGGFEDKIEHGGLRSSGAGRHGQGGGRRSTPIGQWSASLRCRASFGS